MVAGGARPWTRRDRNEAGGRTLGEHHEWLAGVMAEMDRKAGVGVPCDEAYLASSLDRQIEAARDRMRLAEELRAVIVRPMSPTAPSPATQVEAVPAGSPS